MKLLLTVFATVALCSSFANADTENVVTLTDANFDEFVKTHDYVLAEFYAPWCGHCKKLAPEYEKAATALKAEFPNVVLAKIDATEEKTVAEKFGITGFPTLKWIVKGETKEYTGGRTEATITQWIKKKVGPPAKTISTAADVESFKAGDEVVVVGVFADEAQAKAFLSAAADSESIPYAIATGSAVDAVKGALGVNAAPAIVLFKKFDEGKAVYSGDVSDAAAIGKFVTGNSLPLITPFSQENAQKIFGGNIKQHLLIFVDKTQADTTKSVLDAATPVAKSQVGTYLFVSVDKTDTRILEFFGITDAMIPTARIVELGEAGMKKYKLTEKVSTESLTAFVKDHTAGKLPLDLKSEEIPAKQEGDVFVLVAKQFDEIIKSGKNVLVEFYAPWCGHCKKLAPIYDELAAKYKGNDNLIIAKFDGTANEVESVQIQGFPTLKFWPAGASEPIDYNDGRDLESLSKFLEEKIPGLKAK